MLVKLGCRYVIVGHSERRRFHGEDDDMVNAKTMKASERGVTPIVCVGEGLEVRARSWTRSRSRCTTSTGALAGPHRGADREHGDRVRARLGDRHRTGRHP